MASLESKDGVEITRLLRVGRTIKSSFLQINRLFRAHLEDENLLVVN